jgi:hypothetical protein
MLYFYLIIIIIIILLIISLIFICDGGIWPSFWYSAVDWRFSRVRDERVFCFLKA